VSVLDISQVVERSLMVPALGASEAADEPA
jgi:hypothetical protein